MLIETEVRKSFNKAANTYEPYSNMQKVVGEKLIAKLGNDTLQHSSLILDVGSGTGFISQLLRKDNKNNQIISVDIAYEMLRRAKLTKWKIRNYYICADAKDLPLPDRSVDLIVSNLMLHWHTDISAVIREWHRVLRPRGILLFSTLGPLTLYELRNSWNQVDQLTHINKFIEPEELEISLVTTKFENFFLEKEKLLFQYPALNCLFESLKKTGVHNMNTNRLNGLTGKKRFKLFLKAYEQYQQVNMQWPATYELIYGWAQKLPE